MTTAKQRKILRKDRSVRYIIDIAEKLGIDLSKANEIESRRILHKLPAFSEEIVRNRRS